MGKPYVKPTITLMALQPEERMAACDQFSQVKVTICSSVSMMPSDGGLQNGCSILFGVGSCENPNNHAS